MSAAPAPQLEIYSDSQHIKLSALFFAAGMGFFHLYYITNPDIHLITPSYIMFIAKKQVINQFIGLIVPMKK